MSDDLVVSEPIPRLWRAAELIGLFGDRASLQRAVESKDILGYVNEAGGYFGILRSWRRAFTAVPPNAAWDGFQRDLDAASVKPDSVSGPIGSRWLPLPLVARMLDIKSDRIRRAARGRVIPSMPRSPKAKRKHLLIRIDDVRFHFNNARSKKSDAELYKSVSEGANIESKHAETKRKWKRWRR